MNNSFFDKWKENSNTVKFRGSEVIDFQVPLFKKKKNYLGLLDKDEKENNGKLTIENSGMSG